MGRREHNERQFRYVLAGGNADEYPEYEGSGEEQDIDSMKAEAEMELSTSPLVRRVVEG